MNQMIKRVEDVIDVSETEAITYYRFENHDGSVIYTGWLSKKEADEWYAKALENTRWQVDQTIVYRTDVKGRYSTDALMIQKAGDSIHDLEGKKELADKIAMFLNGADAITNNTGGQKAWVVHCSTGCTCCKNENFYQGPYRTIEDAEQSAAYNRQNPILRSQYSDTGVYKVEEVSLVDLGVVLIIDGWYATTNWDNWKMDRYHEGY